MIPFSYTKAHDEASALASAASGARYIAGGTTLVDLMRETVERPERSSTSTRCRTAVSICNRRDCASGRWCECRSWPRIPVCAKNSR